MKSVIAVGIGGVLGSWARFFIAMQLNSRNDWFPIGTLVVNLAGSFFLAFFLTFIMEYMTGSSFLVLSVATGFTGSFTTFSSMSVEGVQIAQVNPAGTLIYFGLSFALGIILAFVGKKTAKLLTVAMQSRKFLGGRKM